MSPKAVLGPLLFLVFIKDIEHSTESIIKLFADDTSMSLGLTNPDTRAKILTCDLVKISDWAKLWKIKFKEEKTELVNIKRDTKPVHQLTFGNVVLEDKPHHKHLGITLQNNCKWDEHISNISSKVNILINCLRHFKYKLGRKALEIMYKSFILPFFFFFAILILSWIIVPIHNLTYSKTFILKPYELSLVLSGEEVIKNFTSRDFVI